jgi:hypothetical protein
MADTRLIIKVDNEDAYFQKQEQEKIREYREKIALESEAKYCEDHKYHCFRCGTPSLMEVRKDEVTVDVCVNENCGAVHLDAGELEDLLENQTFIKNVKKSITDIFK